MIPNIVKLKTSSLFEAVSFGRSRGRWAVACLGLISYFCPKCLPWQFIGILAPFKGRTRRHVFVSRCPRMVAFCISILMMDDVEIAHTFW